MSGTRKGGKQSRRMVRKRKKGEKIREEEGKKIKSRRGAILHPSTPIPPEPHSQNTLPLRCLPSSPTSFPLCVFLSQLPTPPPPKKKDVLFHPFPVLFPSLPSAPRGEWTRPSNGRPPLRTTWVTSLPHPSARNTTRAPFPFITIFTTARTHNHTTSILSCQNTLPSDKT